MKCLSHFLVLIAVTLVVAPAIAQQRVASKPAVPRSPGADQASRAQIALQDAAESGRYTLLFFWKERNASTDRAWATLQAAMPKFADWADAIAVQATEPAEHALVEKLGVSRAPMPLVLAIAPCGAVTKAFHGKLEEADFATARVSPCAERCLKGLQERKLVFVCVQNGSTPQTPSEVPAAVRQMQADTKYGPVMDVVMVDGGNAEETPFLQDLKIDPKAARPVSVLLAPPGSVVGTFDAAATKQQIVAKLAASQSGCCPGGKCGPNGCGPKQ